MQNSLKYTITLNNKAALKGWKTLEESSPEALAKCRHFLVYTPLDIFSPGGKVKKLNGSWKGLLQYDVTDSARVHYWVNQNKLIVYVEYAGPHP
jgi:mRNA-degrading endonuclease RelE of RelBE toxin-antitoxin system